jgi:hypothetical protein
MTLPPVLKKGTQVQGAGHGGEVLVPGQMEPAVGLTHNAATMMPVIEELEKLLKTASLASRKQPGLRRNALSSSRLTKTTIGKKLSVSPATST